MYSILLDSQNYCTNTYAEIGNVINGTNIPTLPQTEPINYKFYKWQDETKTWIFDETKYNNSLQEATNININQSIIDEINVLKSKLEKSDYKIIKCQEYLMSNLDLPYDIADLNKERQTIRDRINELETML